MSARGLERAAAVFSAMQETRVQLMNGDTQDILLGQMLSKANDHIKGDFMRIIEMKDWPIENQPKRALKGLST